MWPTMQGEINMKYQTRVQEVEAIKFDGDVEQAKEFLGGAIVDPVPDHIGIDTPEGFYIARKGDYIVKDSSGNFTAMDAATFEGRYQAKGEPSDAEMLEWLDEHCQSLSHSPRDGAPDWFLEIKGAWGGGVRGNTPREAIAAAMRENG